MRQLKKGDRIKLISMANDPDPIKPGATGTVTGLCNLWDSETQVHIKWDDGRTAS
jgi:hypothetical protein